MHADALRDRVRRTIGQHGLAGPDTRIVVALSGGSDSVALAYLLKELADRGGLAVAGAAHFNHQLRAEADEDERFCGQVAAALGWRLIVDRADVVALARSERRSVESAARGARHAFLERARVELGADRVALGHTRDDQAETFLLRLIRGAGVRGLAAMHPRRGALIRPLLDCRRRELRAYLTERQIGWREDASNLDLTIPRNRVRAELVPLLESRFNPAVVDALADAAEIAREEWRVFDESTRRLLPTVVRRAGLTWRIDAEGLNALPVAMARAAIVQVMEEASGGRRPAFRHVEDVRRLSQAGEGPLHMPGHVVQREGGDLVLTGRPHGGRPGTPEVNLFRYPLSIPGEVAIPEADQRVSAVVAASLAGVPDRAGPGSGVTALVRLDRCKDGLAVRSRRPGDAFRPLGLRGRKKLQDFFVDRKVPRSARDRVPIVVDVADRIVWVAGHGIAEEFRVTDPAQPVLVLTLTDLGGPG
jgi:tRNA(Ile)-lysidine synthase